MDGQIYTDVQRVSRGIYPPSFCDWRLAIGIMAVTQVAVLLIGQGGLSTSHPLTEPLLRRGRRVQFSLSPALRRGGVEIGGDQRCHDRRPQLHRSKLRSRTASKGDDSQPIAFEGRKNDVGNAVAVHILNHTHSQYRRADEMGGVAAAFNLLHELGTIPLV